MMTQNTTNQENVAVKRRGILFIYGAEWCNPNGDPSFDNEPRIRGGRVFVTDVFLKRRIRDYVYYKYGSSQDSKKEQQEQNDKSKQKEEYENNILIRERYNDDGTKCTIEEAINKSIKINLNNLKESTNQLIKKFWDIRVFGIMAPLKGATEQEKGGSIKLIGPCQATFGISLNEVEKISLSITSVMATEKEAKGGAIGEKHVVPVAIIEQYLFINDIAAKDTGMREEDYYILLDALKNFGTIPTTKTSSKNLYPIAIVEVSFNKDKYANLMGLVKLTSQIPEEKIRYIRDYKIDLSDLISKIGDLVNKEIIENYKIYIKKEFIDVTNITEVLKDTTKIEEI